jgi:class 3 adenylate cyclase
MPDERKLVTILFADVTGSTALGEALDPEDVRALMSRYYQHARRVVIEHGGTLEKFIGDAAMAVFGLPQAHGNDPERALAAALALRAAVAEDPVLAPHFVLHAGVNTGEVATAQPAVDPATADSLVTGDAVNTAARLYDAAEPGEILAGERTRTAAEAAFLFGERRLLAAKNKRQPVAASPLLGPRPARRMTRPPLVGRRRELAQMGLLRDRTLEERRPQLASIVAPAGAGKTRLLEEFLARLPRAAGFRAATARCLPYGQALTYWPLRGLLEGLLGGEAFTAGRVAAAFAKGGHSPEEAERLAGLVLASLGIDPAGSGTAQSGAAEREPIFNAWRALLEALARQAPRIVVFEDLHWASDSLLDLVEHVMHPRTRAALLLIATARPELLDRRQGWGGGRRNFLALALEPLDEAQTRTLVRALAKKLPEAARERIVERSGGNPFFAIELTRTAAEHTEHAEREGRDWEHEALPDTVHEALQAQLDQLAPRQKRVLQAAAVAGRTFHAATLQSLVDGGASAGRPATDGIEAALDELLARDLIVLAEPEAAHGAYTFRHILIRDVAYGTLARAERVRLHAAVAASLERFAAGRLDEFAEVIAYHYHEAVKLARQSVAPLALPFDAAVAVRSLERAGEVAGRIGAVVEARRHLEAAIALAQTKEHLRLYEKLGDCAIFGQAALDAYETALARWRASSGADPLVGARLLRKMLICRTRWAVGYLPEDEMEALRVEARQLARAASDEEERWRLGVVDLFWSNWQRENITPHYSVEVEDEIRRLGPALAGYFEARGEWEAMSEVLDGYARMLVEVGAHLEATEVARRRLALPGLSYLERGDASAMLAKARMYAGDYAGSIEVAWQTVTTLSAGVSPTLLAEAAGWGALAACIAGHWSDASKLAAVVEEAWEAGEHDAAIGSSLRGFISGLHIATAREDRAAADRALATLQRIWGSSRTMGASFVISLLTAYRNDDVHALDNAIPAGSKPFGGFWIAVTFLSERGVPWRPDLLRFARETADRSREDIVVRTVAVAEALAAGDDAWLAAAIKDAEAHGLIPHAARMRIVLAQRTGDRDYLELARPVLERLGDRQFLRRLEEVQAALQ